MLCLAIDVIPYFVLITLITVEKYLGVERVFADITTVMVRFCEPCILKGAGTRLLMDLIKVIFYFLFFKFFLKSIYFLFILQNIWTNLTPSQSEENPQL